MSRRSKFTEPVIKRILDAIRIGSTYQIASEYAGISEVTLYNWIKQGHKQTKGKFRDFLDQLRVAEADSAVGALACIQTEIKQGNLKAAFFLLERRHNYKREWQHHRANTIRAEAPKQAKSETIKDTLIEQASDLRTAMQSASKSESWQAYAALQRQLLQVIQQMQTIKDEEAQIDKMDVLSDEQLLGEITNVIIALPPLARQRIMSELSILSNDNVIPLKK
tara:strand:- start:35 stop:700 length:666 start_codon:yes stop_codon:yes gene_type:complete